MKIKRLQLLLGSFLIMWFQLGIAQDIETEKENHLRKNLENISESSPYLTKEQLKMFAHKTKKIEVERALKRDYENSRLNKSEQPDNSQMEVGYCSEM